MIIDEYYQGLVEKLTQNRKIKQISTDLLSKTQNYERVLFTYDIFKEFSTFPKVDKVEKSESLSSQHRNHGNQCFQSYKYLQAWQYYNLALLYAPLNSDTFYLSVSNRSAVFYELKKYNECIKDIQYVFKYDIPESLRERLNKRQEMAEAELLKQMKINKNAENDVDDKLTLKGERDPVYVSSSKKLEVKYSEDMGRHVIAKEDINVGEVLADEESYTHLINIKQILFACSYCLSRDLNLLPCDSCCFALYCSDKCKAQALKEYHSVECPLMATLINMDFTKLEWLALRIVIKARNDHESWSSLFTTIEEAESNIGTKLHGQVKVNDKWIYDSKHYTSIHTLETNVDKRSISDIFQKSVTAAVFLRFLEESTFLDPKNDEDKEKIRQVVAGCLLLHVMTVPTNMHNLSTNIEDMQGKYTEELSLGSGAYAFHSLLNHSCAPNVARFNSLGKTTTKMMALRPIKKGMQVFDNYGAHHAVQDFMSRIQTLKFQYKFVCHCEACINNWPTYLCNGLKRHHIPVNFRKTKDQVLSKATIGLLERGDKKTAIKIYDKLCNLCQALDPYVPCIDVCDCQEALKQCLMILEGLLPYGHTQTIQWDVVPK